MGAGEWALVVAFLAAIIGAVAIVGTLLPGTVIVMGVAGAASAAGQPMLPFMAVAAPGAVLGDYLSYWIGYRYRFVIRQWWPLAQRPRLMAGADRFFARYGAYSVALCRFSPVLRSTVPLVAGITGMTRGRFLLANVTSACFGRPSISVQPRSPGCASTGCAAATGKWRHCSGQACWSAAWVHGPCTGAWLR
jgi:membrane protein DedA with SNARE-associated domain